MFQRRHYQTIAAALRDVRPDPDGNRDVWHAWARSVESVAHRFRMDNPRFDGARFHAAAGYMVIPR